MNGSEDSTLEPNKLLQNELLDLYGLCGEDSNSEDDGHEEVPDCASDEGDESETELDNLTGFSLTSINYDSCIEDFCDTSEEIEIISQCSDHRLQLLLIDNRVRRKALKELCNKFIRELCDYVQIIKDTAKKRFLRVSIPKSIGWKLGAPYFKDKKFFRCPPNSDVSLKKFNQEYSLLDFREGRRWSANDQITLQNTIENVFYEQCFNDLRYQIKLRSIELKRSDKIDCISNEIFDLNSQLSEMKSNITKFKTPPYLETNLDWNTVAEAFKGARGPNECKALWNIYLHPDINKTLWTDEENEKIKLLAKKYNAQNWDLIAIELNTNRSGYLTFLNYVTNLHNKFKIDRFTPSEDRRLQDIIEEYRVGSFIPWHKVTIAFKDRGRQQLYHRYKYYLSKDSTKGAFTEAEDVLLIYLIKKFGKNYSKCATYVPHRNAIQIRNRHSTYLNRWVTRGNYTQADDEHILKYVKENGDSNWRSLAEQLNRTRSHVRQRYYNLRKWLAKPNCTLETLSRRHHNIVLRQHLERFNRIHEVAVMLENHRGEVTLSVAEDFLDAHSKNGTKADLRSVTKKKSATYYDNQIIEFFKGTFKIQRDYKSYNSTSLSESAERIPKLMDLLSADLKILFHADPELVSDRDCDLITTIQQQNRLKDLCSMEPSEISFMFPPTLNTILGLRWLIVKYQIYKETSKSAVSNSLEKLESNPEKYLFFMRFCALFKWASLASQFFPEQLNSDEAKKAATAPKPKGKIGRPKKTVNPRVLKMLCARQQKKCAQQHDIPVSVTIPHKTHRSIPRAKVQPGVYPLNVSAVKVKSEGTKDRDGGMHLTDESEDDLDIDDPNLPSRKRKRSVVTYQITSLNIETMETVIDIKEPETPTSYLKILNNVPVVDTDTIKKLGLANKNIIVLDKTNFAGKSNVEKNGTQVYRIITKKLDVDSRDVDVIDRKPIINKHIEGTNELCDGKQ